jgi:predicted porin
MNLAHPNTRLAIALGLAWAAGGAAAQSSVTLFGVADAAARTATTQGVGTIKSLASGSYSSSRWGVRGQEDLGNGLSVSFWLESFLNLDTGVVTPAGFQRRATVSLVDRDLGELRLGRDYTPTHSNWSRFDPFGYVGIGANQLLILSATGTTPVTAAFGTAPNTVQRANNGIQYLLPRNAWGVEGGLSVNAGEGGLAANDQHKSSGGRLGVTVGPFFVQASKFDTQNEKTIGKFKDSGLGASYQASFARFSVATRQLKYQNAKQNNTLLAALVPFGAQEFKFSWNRAQMEGAVGATNISANRADQYALGYVYNFSKRTRAYATWSTIRNTGNSRFVVPGAPAATAAGQSSRGLEIGLNQEF